MDNLKKKPELIVIAGPNGSGKTTVTNQFLHHEWSEGVVYINPDQVAKDIFGDWNSMEAVLDAANYCEAWRERCLSEKISFVFETVFSAQDKIDFIIRAKKAGFFIRLFFIATEHPSINAARITNSNSRYRNIRLRRLKIPPTSLQGNRTATRDLTFLVRWGLSGGGGGRRG